ncbi:tail fiber protein [Paenibacillus antarcticus]|uniref:Tail fiber protein n=1 Tax=Paenibacillus antarcticus TaxID=253703 RepID=A0A168P9J3_9BACL|nr:tail fiber protein [Paenibacillus antarcticus]OAB46533.1 hypothetical protein PBAT_10975 [Paenibacillus antarcticus]
MSSNTPNLGLLKKDPTADRNDTFNIKTMMNDNWDKVDAAVGQLQEDIQNIDVDIPDASLTVKGITKLNSVVNSPSETEAATPKAVKIVNDSVIAHKADNAKHIPHLGTTTNVGNVYSITTAEVIATNQKFTVKINAASTGAATLKVSSIASGTAKAVQKAGGTNATLKIGVYTLFWDGTAFQLLGEGGEYGTAVGADVRSTKTFGTEDGVIQGALDLTQLTAQNLKKNITVDGITGVVEPLTPIGSIIENLNVVVNYIGNLSQTRSYFIKDNKIHVFNLAKNASGIFEVRRDTYDFNATLIQSNLLVTTIATKYKSASLFIISNIGFSIICQESTYVSRAFRYDHTGNLISQSVDVAMGVPNEPLFMFDNNNFVTFSGLYTSGSILIYSNGAIAHNLAVAATNNMLVNYQITNSYLYFLVAGYTSYAVMYGYSIPLANPIKTSSQPKYIAFPVIVNGLLNYS